MVTFGIMAVQISVNNRVLCLDPRAEDRGCCQHQASIKFEIGSGRRAAFLQVLDGLCSCEESILTYCGRGLRPCRMSANVLLEKKSWGRRQPTIIKVINCSTF